MLKRVGTILAVVVPLLGLGCLANRALNMSFVPTAQQISQQSDLAAFQVLPVRVDGIYGNYDNDALVFRYISRAENEATLRTQIDELATSAGWKRLSSTNGVLRFERLTPRSSRMSASAEEVRVTIDPESLSVLVGWIQGDPFDDVPSFSSTHESEWANANVWPILEGLPPSTAAR